MRISRDKLNKLAHTVADYASIGDMAPYIYAGGRIASLPPISAQISFMTMSKLAHAEATSRRIGQL